MPWLYLDGCHLNISRKRTFRRRKIYFVILNLTVVAIFTKHFFLEKIIWRQNGRVKVDGQKGFNKIVQRDERARSWQKLGGQIKTLKIDGPKTIANQVINLYKISIIENFQILKLSMPFTYWTFFRRLFFSIIAFKILTVKVLTISICQVQYSDTQGKNFPLSFSFKFI